MDVVTSSVGSIESSVYLRQLTTERRFPVCGYDEVSSARSIYRVQTNRRAVCKRAALWTYDELRFVPESKSTAKSTVRCLVEQSNQDNSHAKRTVSTNCCIHTVVPPDDGLRYARNM